MSGTVFWMRITHCLALCVCSNNGMEGEVVGEKGHKFAPFCAPVVGCQPFPPLCSAQENTSDKTAACAACFDGVIFFGVLRLDPNL
jgi:hypothetical protein